jgi:hypothetical protein
MNLESILLGVGALFVAGIWIYTIRRDTGRRPPRTGAES